jgi:hypothetical protein
MAFAEGFERGGRMAQGIIGTYRDANQRARERAAEEEIAALNAQYARSGEMIESPQALGPITRPQVYAAPDVMPTGVTRTNMQTGAQAPVAAPRATTTPFRGQTLGGAPTTPVAQPRIPTAGLVPSTPPAQSQIYQQQADVYSRYGLTDQARRTRDLGLGAARDEERMATEKERYETTQQQYQEGLRREDERNKIIDARYEDEFALKEELHDQQMISYDDAREDRLRVLETNTAIADYFNNSAGRTPEEQAEARAELLSNEKVDYRTVFSTLASSMQLEDQMFAQTLREQSQAAELDAAQFVADGGEVSYSTAAEIAAKYGVPVGVVANTFTDQIQFTEAQAIQQTRIYLQGASAGLQNLDAANEFLVASFDKKEGDTAPTNYKELPGFPGVWGIFDGDELLTEIPTQADIPGVGKGWQIIQKQFYDIASGGDPFTTSLQVAELRQSLGSSATRRLSAANLVEVHKTLHEDSAFARLPIPDQIQRLNTVVQGIEAGPTSATPEETEAQRIARELLGGGTTTADTTTADTTTADTTTADTTTSTPAPDDTTDTAVGLTPRPRGYTAMRQEERRVAQERKIAELAQLQAELESLTARRGGAPVANTPRGREIIARITELSAGTGR